MLALEWRLTLLTLVVLPLFIIPARRIGPTLQTLTREGMQLNASMNNTMAERFNVAGALLVKLFGTPRPRARRRSPTAPASVRDIGVHTAMYSRVLFVALGLVAAVGTAVVYFVGGNLAISGTITIGTLVAFAVLRRPDLPTAHAAHERARRRADRARVVRAGLRGARLPARSITDRPGAVDLVEPAGPHRVRPRVVPPPAGRDVVDRVARGRRHRRRRRRAERLDPARRHASRSSPGELGRARRAVGRGQDHDRDARARASTTSTQGAVRVDGHDVRDLTLESLRDAIGMVHAGPAPLPRHHPRQPALRPARRHRRRAGRRVPARRASTTSIAALPDGLRHRRRRARLPHVGRREAAPRDRPHAAEGPGDRDPRRGDVAPRLRVGARDPAGARRGAARAAPRS